METKEKARETNRVMAPGIYMGGFLKGKKELEEAFSQLPDIDNDIIPYLTIINTYKGVWTLDSCQGHTIDGILQEGKTNKKHPGRTLYPYVTLRFDNPRVYHSFIQEIAVVGDDSSPVLGLFPSVSAIELSPPTKKTAISLWGRQTSDLIYSIPPEKLPIVRKAFFDRIIEALDNVVIHKATIQELEYKCVFIVTIP